MANALAKEIGTDLAKTAVKSALGSLVELIKYEWGLKENVKIGLTSLETELRNMQAFLESVSGIPPDQLDSQVKLRDGEVSQLLNSIEKRLHSFVVSIELNKDNSSYSAVKNWVAKHHIDSYIKETLIKVKEVRERYGPYPSLNSLENTDARNANYNRIQAMYPSEPNPEGIEEATKEVIKMLIKDHHVSIVGMVGLGKTTLARAVYGKMREQFDCGAFVRVGKSADATKVPTDIFSALYMDKYGKQPEINQHKDQLGDFLVGNRSLIVIDDIWNEGTWNSLESTFKVSVGTKVIITTRDRKVAHEVGFVYPIKKLSPEHSLRLLRIKAEADVDDSTDFDEVSAKILEKCDGVPMAINAVGRFLAKNKSKGWHTAFEDSGFADHIKGGVLENIKRALSCGYYGLPSDIQKCLLYLSLFPEDHLIEKNMLIWRWVAEGLVRSHSGQRVGSFQLGETYFNELIDRCMIQWVVSPSDIGQGVCSVHSLMFELIRHLSSSNDRPFSSVIGLEQESTSQTSTINIDRLAIHKKGVDEPSAKENPDTSGLKLEEVLSFYAYTCQGSSMPPLSRFVLLRVIDLERCDLSVGDQKLEHLAMSSSPELSYLGLSFTRVPDNKLPEEIRHLKLLQTLDVTGTGINELPPFVCELKNVRCLRAGKGTRMMGPIGKMTSLEELWLHSADKSPSFATELGKLTQLRVVVVHFDEMDKDMQEELVESLRKLRELESLQVWSDAEEKVLLDVWEGSVPSSKELSQLLLFGVILGRPMPWIAQQCVPKLSKLLLEVETLDKEQLEILGKLLSLHSLYLHSKENTLSYTAGRDEFKALEYLYTNIELVCGDKGLPRMQELEVAGIKAGKDVGLRGNMPLLQKATYHLDCIGCTPVDIDKAEAALVEASIDHPKHPTVSIKRFNNIRLVMQHEFFGSVVPEIVKAALKALPVKGLAGSPGLGGARGKGKAANDKSTSFSPAGFGGQEHNANSAFFNILSDPAFLDAVYKAAVRSTEAVGAPSTLAVGKNAGTSSTSKDIETSNDSTFSQFLESLVLQSGMDVTVPLNALRKCIKDPQVLATMKCAVQNTDGSLSLPDHELPRVLQAIARVAISEFEQSAGALGKGEGTSANTGLTIGTQAGWSDESSEVHGDNMLATFDSLVAANALPLTDPAGSRKMLERFVQNPEIIECMNRLLGGSQTIVSTMTQQTNVPPVTGRGADAGLASKKHLSAQNSAGTSGSSCEPPLLFDANCMISLVNSQFGANFLSEEATFYSERFAWTKLSAADFRKIIEKCMHKPEMIAAMQSAGQKNDFSGMDQVLMEMMAPDIMNHVIDQCMGVPSPTSGDARGGEHTDFNSQVDAAAEPQGVDPAEGSSQGGDNSSKEPPRK